MNSKEQTTYDLVSKALGDWHKSEKLGQNLLARWRLVDVYLQNNPHLADSSTSRAQALKFIIRQAVDELFLPAGASPPEHLELDQRRYEKEWRAYAILSLQFFKGKGYQDVMSLIGLMGGNYYDVRRPAIQMLADHLSNAEKGLREEFKYKFPGGVMSATDPYYVYREQDRKVAVKCQQLRQIVTLIGSGQMGKTSMMLRGLARLEQSFSKAQIVIVEFQKLQPTQLTSLGELLYQIGLQIVEQLDLDFEAFNQMWSNGRYLTPHYRLDKVFVELFLPAVQEAFVLVFDDVDVLYERPYKTDFFTMVRNWYNNGALKPVWKKLFIFLLLSTEPYLLTDNQSQSPFNVGEKLYLSDLTLSQVSELNKKYHTPFTSQELENLQTLLNGHPYLTRLALYEGASKQKCWADVETAVLSFHPPFREHLDHQLSLIHENQALRQRLKQIIKARKSKEDDLTSRLLKAGLITRANGRFECRCLLYQKFFEKFL